MDYPAIAAEVLDALGGKDNIVANSMCVTRLRVTVSDASRVDRDRIGDISGVLGMFSRGDRRYEVVFGPNSIMDVYRSFAALTNLDGGHEGVTFHRSSKNLSVSITPRRTTPKPADSAGGGSPAREPIKPPSGNEPGADDDLSVLMALMGDEAPSAGSTSPQRPRMRLLVLNGPNINLIGIREPKLYGSSNFSELLRLCRNSATEAGFTKCVCFQSNHEGDLVDHIQDAYGVFDGIVINPGAYTHTSIAILDALKAVDIPTIEVHISDVSAREDFRQVSYVRMACIDTVMGEGINGYRTAIFKLAEHIRSQEG